jgi:hypothetical protein
VLPNAFEDYMVMTPSPTCYLIADEGDGAVDIAGVPHLNTVARAGAAAFVSARYLYACPGL